MDHLLIDTTNSIRKNTSAHDFEQNIRVPGGQLLKDKFEKFKKDMIVDFLNLPITKRNNGRTRCI